MSATQRLLLWLVCGALIGCTGSDTGPLVVASKKFTEGAILGEIATLLLQTEDIDALHRSRLGGTTICFTALEAGEIDVYADYTGTLIRELLAELNLENYGQLEQALQERGVGITKPLGFDNTYAIAVRSETARQHGLRTLSDFAKRPELRLGFGPEFIARKDCWPGLRETYGLRHEPPISIQHELAYQALASEQVDAIEVYTTDAKIPLHDIAILEDDQTFFPRYQAVYLYRLVLAQQNASVEKTLRSLEGKISTSAMQTMNSSVEIDQISEAQAAATFLRGALNVSPQVKDATITSRILRRTREHLLLVGASLGLGIFFGIPIGYLCTRRYRLGQVVLAGVGLIQTIPSLALLVLMIPLLGLEAPPAIVALFLYSLLPIVRNTYAGLQNIPAELTESALALGLPSRARLLRIELPLAAPTILAGIKVAATLNVGFATLGAFVGAGGYGAPILTGLDLNNMGMILEGALPAAGLALLVQFGFELLERRVVTRGLRLSRE